ncbi:hypothetical protein [Moorena sp. SIO4G3]|uniref:hypothetical protein n=1 Tax=Moorena sp. SIO4G3 TaxID=2607821 RepID=UPI0025E1740C|nr:hypothetical protein [Moorena sp. SIO4G3]
MLPLIGDIDSNRIPASLDRGVSKTGAPAQEFLYITDTIPNQPDPPGSFADNGLV